jgi:integrase
MARKKTGTRNLNGMGNVYFNKRTERYEYRKMQDGELRYTSAKTPAELKEKVNQLSNMPISKEKIKLHDWADKWLSVYVKPLRKASTHKQYEDTWKAYIKPNIKNILLRSVKSFDLQSVIAKMHEKELSAASMKQARKVLNLMFEKALSEKLIAENPVKAVEIPDVQQKARKVLKLEELRAMFEFLNKSRWFWPIRFMLVTGLRRGELLALKWSDIDENERVITVSDNMTDHGISTTKSNKVHYVPLSSMAIECLAEFKKQLQNEENPAIWQNESDIIFVGQKGEPMKPHSLNNVFKWMYEATGIKASPHSMRHTFVYYSKNKLSLSELKDSLGHDATTSTLDIYGNMLANNKVIAEKIDDIFEEVVKEEPKQAVGGDNVVSFEERKK